MFTVALFIVASNWKQPKSPSTDERIKKSCIHTMDSYSAGRKNKVLIHAATWINLENVVIIKPVTEEHMYDYIMSRVDKSTDTESRLVFVCCWGERRIESDCEQVWGFI